MNPDECQGMTARFHLVLTGLAVAAMLSCARSATDPIQHHEIDFGAGRITFGLPAGYQIHNDIVGETPTGTWSLGISPEGEQPEAFDFVITVLTGDNLAVAADLEELREARVSVARTSVWAVETDELIASDSQKRLTLEFQRPTGAVRQEAYIVYPGLVEVVIIADSSGGTLSSAEQRKIFESLISTLELDETSAPTT